MSYIFRCAPQIIVRQGAVKELAPVLKGMGTRFLLCADAFFFESDLTASVCGQIKSFGAEVLEARVYPGEPTIENVDKLFYETEGFRPDAVIALGGGSAIDTAKAIAVMMTNGAPCLDYLEYVGKGKKIENKPLDLITIPTTAGTGSEVGNVSVLCSHEMNFKRAVRHPDMIPKLALIDPELYVGAPPKVTAASGMDALAHNIESYSSWRSTPLSEMCALKGIEAGGKYLLRAYQNPDDLEAREGMCVCSVMGGLARMNAGVGAAHGIGMAVGIEYGLSHGEAVGIALPDVMELNAKYVPERIAKIGEVLTGKHFEIAKEGAAEAVRFMKELRKGVGMPDHFKYLGTPPDRMDYFAKAIQGNSLNGNPAKLELNEWAEFLGTIL